VFRILVVSFALTLAASPSAAVLCDVWCAPPDAATTECHDPHTSTSPRVTAGETCEPTSLASWTFVRGYSAGTQAPKLLPAILIPGFRLALPAGDARAVSFAFRSSPFAPPPLNALRI
jgi:hypothetical protein